MHDVQAVLFDMDGTLLPMDQDVFAKAYFKELCKKLAFRGYEPGSLVDSIWRGTGAMVRNDGTRPNEEAFWESFAKDMGPGCIQDRPLFDAFYENEFNLAREVCGFNEAAGRIVQGIRAKGIPTILASNPIFPLAAQRARARWAGVDPEGFAYITTYENSRYCKPNPKYYLEICEKNGLDPAHCLMVGNDATEDLVASTLGIRVFLLTDCLINKEGYDLSDCSHGGYEDLEAWLEEQGV